MSTFKFGDYHRAGDATCDVGWCSIDRYPKPCEQSNCTGLVHANFGDEDADCNYWLDTKCDVCGEPE